MKAISLKGGLTVRKGGIFVYRKIKFRWWYKNEKQMFRDRDYFSISGRVNEIFTSKSYIPMQYTGLKDTNGKEIYEGDIVKWIHDDGYFLAEIKFIDSAFRMVGKDFEDSDGFNILEQDGCSEIIGNIYENKGLFKCSQ